MEQANPNLITGCAARLAELRIAHAQLRGMVSVLARCAVTGAPLSSLEAAALADSMYAMLGAADLLLAEARGEHQRGVAPGRLPLLAPRLRVIAEMIRGVAGEA